MSAVDLILPCFLVASFSGLATGCGSSSALPSDAGAGEIDAGAKCGNMPRLLVDYARGLTDAAAVGVEPAVIAVNATDLFYLVNVDYGLPRGGSDGSLYRIPLTGGTAVRLAAIAGGGSPGAQALVATATGAIYSEPRDGDAGAILSVPATGGPGTVLASTSGQAQALVADDQNVYFVDMEATKSVPLTGGPVRTVATAVPYSLGVAGGTLYLADDTGNTVSSVPTGGGAVSVLATNQPGALYPVRCGPNVCWVAGAALQENLMQLAPGGTPVMLAGGFSEALDLVFDGTNFFVTEGAGGFLLERIPSDGGGLFPIATGPGITSLALDHSCLYWSNLQGISTLALSAADMATSTVQ